MKSTLALIVCLSVFALVSAEKTREEKDNLFFQGMETGFFLRNKPQGYKDYDCPDVTIDMEVNKEITNVFAPMKMMLSVMNDDTLNVLLDLLQVFIDEIQVLQAASSNY